MEKDKVEEEYERCAVCGELTGIPVSMPVDWREDYEIGLGQICTVCAKKYREEAEKAKYTGVRNKLSSEA